LPKCAVAEHPRTMTRGGGAVQNVDGAPELKPKPGGAVERGYSGVT
jgi:hypothetical protein